MTRSPGGSQPLAVGASKQSSLGMPSWSACHPESCVLRGGVKPLARADDSLVHRLELGADHPPVVAIGELSGASPERVPALVVGEQVQQRCGEALGVAV